MPAWSDAPEELAECTSLVAVLSFAALSTAAFLAVLSPLVALLDVVAGNNAAVAA